MAFERLKSAVSALRGLPAGVDVPSSAYLRGLPGGQSSVMAMPMPVLRDSSDDVRQAWGKAAGRAVDAMHNNGWIAGVTECMVSLMIGDGLRPNLKPDFSAFGWDENQTAEWARRAEMRFHSWASNKYECDAGGRYTLGQLQAAGVRQWFGTGETLAEVPTIRRSGGQFGTKMRLLPSHWLSQRSEPFDRLEHGVYQDRHGAPAGYLFEMKDKFGSNVDVRKAARDFYGRPIIVHVFDGNAGQIRGITPFAPILRVLRDYDQLANATLTAAMIHAIFAATIESEYPTTEILDALKDEDETEEDEVSRFDAFMGQKVGWHKNVDIDLGRHGKIAHLMMGEKLNLHSSQHPNSAFEPFANFLLREVARAAGALTPDLTGDYRGESYSSIKAGIAKQWPLLIYRRTHIAAPPSQALLEAFIEEDIDSGALEIPGGIDAFLANKASICRAKWKGPAKPVADEVKAATAHEKYRNMGVMTDDMICNDLGVDRDDVYRDRKFEKEMRDDLEIHGGINNAGENIDQIDEIAEQTAERVGAANAQ